MIIWQCLRALNRNRAVTGGTGAVLKGENIRGTRKVSIYTYPASQTLADKYNYSLSHLQVLDEYGDLIEKA